MKYLYMLSIDESWEQYAEWKKLDIKGHILYDYHCMKYPELENP